MLISKSHQSHILPKNNIRNQSSSLSFSAVEYPSGCYSDWFVKEVSAETGKPDSDYIKWMDTKLADYKRRLKDEKRFWGSLLISISDIVATREFDYRNLRVDLTNEKLNKEAKETEKSLRAAKQKIKETEEKQKIKDKRALKNSACTN